MVSRASLIIATLVAFGLAASSTALAQTAPPAQATAPAPSCAKPGDPPRAGSTESGKEAAERRRNSWANGMKDYIECLKRFIEEEQAAAAPHIKAVNAGVEEYTKAIKIFNDQAEASRPQ